MPQREDLRKAADALAGSVAVCGVGGYADSLAGRSDIGARVVPVSQLAARGAEHPAAVVIAVEPATIADGPLHRLAETDGFRVGIVPESVSDKELSALRQLVDAVLIAGDADGAEDGVEHAIRSFLAVVQDPGFVNLDLTDAETVLSSGVAAIGTGTAARDAPATAVESAFGGLPDGIDVTDASAVLVDVTLDPVTSIAAATDVIAAVRDRIGSDANVIWGGAVDESVTDELTVRIVVADVRHSPRLDAGDSCPRCGAPLALYAFGASETLSCDGCGFSGSHGSAQVSQDPSITDRAELLTTRRLLVAIASAAKRGLRRPVTASGIATAL